MLVAIGLSLGIDASIGQAALNRLEAGHYIAFHGHHLDAFNVPEVARYVMLLRGIRDAASLTRCLVDDTG